MHDRSPSMFCLNNQINKNLMTMLSPFSMLHVANPPLSSFLLLVLHFLLYGVLVFVSFTHEPCTSELYQNVCVMAKS